MASNLPRWFDRTFAFDFGADAAPGIIRRLRETPAQLEEATHGLRSEALIRRDGDAWSIQENAGHLLDLEPLWLGRIDDFFSGAEALRPADLTNQRTHDARHNDAQLRDILSSFREARSRLIARLSALTDADFERTALHPRLRQPMRLVDHLFFVAEHDAQHLARINELKQS